MPPLALRKPASAVTVAVAFVVLAATFLVAPITPSAAAEVRPMTLPFHPANVDDVQWTDTWGAARGGGRSHIGVDMLGHKMIPLIAVRSATVTWGRFDNGRGSILRLRDDDGWEYQYIHLNNDSPGTDDGSASCAETFSARLCAAIVDGRFASGTRVAEGELIGYMGDGGNAEGTRPHLHFEVYKPSGSGVVAINPTPSVDAAKARLLSSGSSGSTPPPAVGPDEAGFVDHLWFQLHGRYPTSSERSSFEAAAASEGVLGAVAAQVGTTSSAASIDRLYLAFFQRYPDLDGIQYWVRSRGSGQRLEDIAEWFALSDEFTTRYAGLDFGAFLDRLYLDVLGRSPDASGKAYWLGRLEDGEVTRGTIVVYFTESSELLNLTDHRNEFVALSLILNAKVPTEAEVQAWVVLRSTKSLAAAVAESFAT